jgi:hypothetical protein
MNLQKLRENIEWLKKQLGNGLVATDIWSTEVGLSLAGYNEKPEAVALFNEVTRFLRRAIEDTGFPPLGRYYMVELDSGKALAIILVHQDLQWGMLIDTSQATLGLIVSIVLQQAAKRLAEGAAGDDP